MRSKILVTFLIGFTVLGHSFCQVNKNENTDTKTYEVSKSDEEWKSVLSQAQIDAIIKHHATIMSRFGYMNHITH